MLASARLSAAAMSRCSSANGLAHVNAQARTRGEPVTAGGVPLEPVLPDFASFTWPETSANAETAE